MKAEDILKKINARVEATSPSLALKIVEVRDPGVDKNERVILKAIQECNLKNYVVCDNTYDEKGQVSNKLPHMFRFPDFAVKKGEYVSLRSCSGKFKTTQSPDSATFHCFYWGLSETIWNADGDCVHLMELANIQNHKFSSPDKN